jgi:hypothetical protein
MTNLPFNHSVETGNSRLKEASKASEKRRIPILWDKPIRLIKWQKVGLQNLPVSHLLQKKN